MNARDEYQGFAKGILNGAMKLTKAFCLIKTLGLFPSYVQGYWLTLIRQVLANSLATAQQ